MAEKLETDVLILGCGIAGATTALTLAERGLDVTVVTPAGDPQETNTYYAQGGVIYRGVDDSPDLLAEDISAAGAGHCNPVAVRILAEEGPPILERFLVDKLGVPFDRREDGSGIYRASENDFGKARGRNASKPYGSYAVEDFDR